ncbi:MAG: phosphoglucosamine mutase [Vulcanimicrobiaceae bacterium]
MSIFGTDGIRGVANADLTPERAFAIGRAAASVLAQLAGRRDHLILGRDTRCSGTMLEAAMVAGITSVGLDVALIGIVPTPAVACVTVRDHAIAGVMISASHNPVPDNGIKFFGADGFKLTDAQEREIEARLEASDLPRPIGAQIGVASIAHALGRHYHRSLRAQAVDLHGLEIVVDGAYGSAYAVAPYVLRALGARVHELHCEPDGARINVGCGATDLRSLQRAVLEKKSTRVIGVAFDGDADRALFVDERGEIVTGDHVLYILARDLASRGELGEPAVVGTVMSNLGLERALAGESIGLLRAPVGDRYVLERMRGAGLVLGAERSGHVIDLRYNTTGDGPMTAVSLLGVMARTSATLQELAAPLVEAPQILINVRVHAENLLDDAQIQAAIAAAHRELDGAGRLLIRPSGTEPLLRVMVEGSERAQVEALAASVAAAIESADQRASERRRSRQRR